VLLLTGCSGETAPEGQLNGSVVDPPFEVGTTALTDTDGTPATLQDSDARLTLVFFGYTRCPDECPAVMNTVTSALTRISEAEREQVQLVYVTTDPAHDTTEVLRRYLDGYDPSFVGLTGELDDIVALGRTVGVFVSEGEPGKPMNDEELGAHGTQVIGMDGSGEAPVFWGMDTSAAQYAADFEQLLEEG
jgi:protein SCO1/2